MTSSVNNGRSQLQPFESEDEGDCWLDISPPSSPSPLILQWNRHVNDDDTSENTALAAVVHHPTESPDSKSTHKRQVLSGESSGRRTPLVQWNRVVCVEKKIVFNQHIGTTLQQHISVEQEQPNKRQKELDDLKNQQEETVKALQTAQQELERSRTGHALVLVDLRGEVVTAKRQREDIEQKLGRKEEALLRTKKEVETLKKIIHQTTSMASMQRDHAVVAVAEKDMILQNYKDRIKQLTRDVLQSKQREQETTLAFEKEMNILQESLQSVQTPLKEEEENEENEPNPTGGGIFLSTTIAGGMKNKGDVQFTTPCSNRTAFSQVDTLINK